MLKPLTLAVCTLLPWAALAQPAASPAVSPAAPLRPDPAFASFPRYAGTLGNHAIELKLGPKPDDPGGVHGEYVDAASKAVVLVAGDDADGVIEMDESDDGSRISGQWIGRFAADGSLKGERMTDDDAVSESFDLHPVSAHAPVSASVSSQHARRRSRARAALRE